MSAAFDFKKEYTDLYLPKLNPVLIDVPSMRFLMVDGLGNPNDTNGEYQKAVEALYGLCYTIKMSKMGMKVLQGYFDYVVPPLEGIRWLASDVFDTEMLMDKSQYHWTSMIRQPDFVDEGVFDWAKAELRRKKPAIDASKVRFKVWTEGLCVQCMHLGTYDEESGTISKLVRHIDLLGYQEAIGDALLDGTIRRHHEIYLGDPRKTTPDKLKTVIRHPVKPKA